MADDPDISLEWNLWTDIRYFSINDPNFFGARSTHPLMRDGHLGY